MNCGICGGQMVMIRGRHPQQPKREVCPTCLAERIDMIREMSDRNYGVAYENIDKPKEIT